MTYLLDSDMLIYFFNQVEPGYPLVSELLTRKERIVISVLTIMEASAGWNADEARELLPILYTLFPIEPLTNAIAERAGRLRYDYTQLGRKPKPIDTLIAATALEYQYCLITNNRDDYPMPELLFYDAPEASEVPEDTQDPA